MQCCQIYIQTLDNVVKSSPVLPTSSIPYTMLPNLLLTLRNVAKFYPMLPIQLCLTQRCRIYFQLYALLPNSTQRCQFSFLCNGAKSKPVLTIHFHAIHNVANFTSNLKHCCQILPNVANSFLSLTQRRQIYFQPYAMLPNLPHFCQACLLRVARCVSPASVASSLVVAHVRFVGVVDEQPVSQPNDRVLGSNLTGGEGGEGG